MAPKMKSRQKASQEYWEEREKEALKQTRLTEEQFAAEIEKIYGDMRREVNSRISNWYVRYADESGIDIAEAKKRVSKLDMEEYAELARKYVELARKEETRAQAFTDEANEQMKLYNLTMKVNRLENLKAQIGLELCGGFSQLEKKYGTFLTEQMMEEFDRQSGILAMTTQRPEAVRRQIEAVVNGSFHNATFSERLWNQQDALKSELDRLLSRALIQGLNPRAVAPALRKKFGASEMAADLLMITELCRVQTEAQKMAFKEYGYEEYTFICNGGACEACEGLSGKHFKVSEMQPGLNAPPMHPRCRCSTAAYMDREKFDKWLDALERGEDVRKGEFENKIEPNHPEPLSRAYVNHTDQLYKNLMKVKPISGYEDFGVHGVPKESKIEYETTNGVSTKYSASEFAEILLNDPNYHGGKVRLLSCGAGSDKSGFAQELARILGKEVLAPTETLWVGEEGDLFISDNEILADMWYNNGEIDNSILQTGRWKPFYP